MRMIVALVSLVALAGCAAQAEGGCGSLGVVDYDQAFQEKLATELEVAGPNAAWPDAIADYRALRSDVKACQEKEQEKSRVKLW